MMNLDIIVAKEFCFKKMEEI